jgi:hypothetical protein
VYLTRHEGQLYHVKYRWNEVYRSSTGDWASCGCDDLEDAGREAAYVDPHCLPVVFSPPVAVDLRHASAALVQRYRDNPDYRVGDAWAECVRGVLVDDAYPDLRTHVWEADEATEPDRGSAFDGQVPDGD